VTGRPAWRRNLCEVLLDDRVERHGDRPVLATPEGRVGYAELAGRVGAIAGGLAEWGVRPGMRVALVRPDSADWAATFLAVVRLGAVAVLASPATAAGPLRDALTRADVALLITDDDEILPGAHRLDGAAVRHLADGGFADPGPAGSRASDACYMLSTSGSTGPSKWAVHRHGDIPACIATYGRHILRLGPGDVTWSVAALPTSYGLGNTLYFPMGAGACSWTTGEFPSPLEAVRACEDGGANVLFGVPAFWARLARHAAAGRVPAAAFGAVRLAVSAGEPLAPAVWSAVHDALGLRLVDGLGSSEATNLYLSQTSGRPRPGSVGRVVPGYELRVVDDDERPLPDGSPGQLLVRGPTLMSEYLDAPDATARALRGGWLHTGDLVVRDPDAAYRFVGRIGERFKSGGFWVDPSRVEELLLTHPAVAEAAVAGVPDADGIMRVAALVVPRHGDGADLPDRLDDLARAGLAAHEVPRAYVVDDALPTAASGKVRRGAVRERLAAALAPEGVR
jgi:acyl-coenzyme A synthetase/AMP-(fatty) acid ligase